MARPSQQEIEDIRNQSKIDAAYNAALRSEGMEAPSKPKAKPKAQPMPSTMPNVDIMGNVTGMKKGGTASSRADGCAQRGKTRGKMV